MKIIYRFEQQYKVSVLNLLKTLLLGRLLLCCQGDDSDVYVTNTADKPHLLDLVIPLVVSYTTLELRFTSCEEQKTEELAFVHPSKLETK